MTRAGWEILSRGGGLLDVVEKGAILFAPAHSFQKAEFLTDRARIG